MVPSRYIRITQEFGKQTLQSKVDEHGYGLSDRRPIGRMAKLSNFRVQLPAGVGIRGDAPSQTAVGYTRFRHPSPSPKG
jgi:hypothetical protein